MKPYTATKNPVTGAWEVSAMVKGYLVRRTFYAFTKREAVIMFNRETRKP